MLLASGSSFTCKDINKILKKAKKAEIKGGVLDGKVLSADEVKTLSELPSKEELYAKMLGSINSPASGIVKVVTWRNARALGYCYGRSKKTKRSASNLTFNVIKYISIVYIEKGETK